MDESGAVPVEEAGFRKVNARVLTVSEVTHQLKELIERNFTSLWVEGEISNFKQAMSGHVYFTLKDEGAQLKAVVFRSEYQNLGFRPDDGMKVVVLGRLSIYENRGEYQIIVDYLQRKGVGILQLRFEQLKNKLASEGLFDEKRKRKIPFLPRRIGIVTSTSGAAIRDILRILERRFRGLHIIIYPVRVQGEGSAEEITEAIDYLNTLEDIDVLIIGRGGGSLEDLWAFNEECVARAIFRSRIPVISAVGHEVDFTISDFVADLRAPTPSAAAELVVKNRDDLLAEVGELGKRLQMGFLNCLQRFRSDFELLSYRLIDPRRRLGELKERIDDIAERMLNGIKRTLELRKEMLSGRAEKLNALSPHAVLERGYSIAFLEKTGEVLKDARRAEVDDAVRVKLRSGEIGCTVRSIKD